MFRRSVADSNRCSWFCRPVTKPLIQPTISSGTTRNRTGDTRIFSPLLYQLSYGTSFLFCGCKGTNYFRNKKIFQRKKLPVYTLLTHRDIFPFKIYISLHFPSKNSYYLLKSISSIKKASDDSFSFNEAIARRFNTFTVSAEMSSFFAISLFFFPSMLSRSTSLCLFGSVSTARNNLRNTSSEKNCSCPSSSRINCAFSFT